EVAILHLNSFQEDLPQAGCALPKGQMRVSLWKDVSDRKEFRWRIAIDSQAVTSRKQGVFA
ncbi:MAG: hypothetical protein CL676_06035, partial [Bdellovibrionaceae bacterium]|nr:hypothetical protein [Pseudobdellovibrionaceae bacterium]